MEIRPASSAAEDGVAELWTRIEAAAPLEDVVLPDFGQANPDESSERSLSQYQRRRSFIANYAWAVPTKEAIAAVASFLSGRRVLEICSGSGLWAKLLEETGLDVLATDGEPARHTYLPVQQSEAEAAVRAHAERSALLVCWPPFRNDCAVRALRAFTGDRCVYAGDVRFNGDASFHELLESGWVLESRVLIPAWPGLDDYVYLYRRKSGLND